MAIIKSDLDKLYLKYGYKKDRYENLVSVYLYEEGRYFGADIIDTIDNEESQGRCEELKKKYSSSGYAVQIKKVSKFEDASDELYKSFFSYDSTLIRLKGKYNGFVKNQKKINGGETYQYINSPYQLNNDTPETNDIVKTISERLKENSPQLIIIEAAAGYGKTCTSYEILNELTKNEKCDNPIITELSRNRGANIFRYILLDEIDREYPTLDSTLVKQEIQSGRIPLIIDGFDELLNKSDLVADEQSEVFGEVEPMLDTIGKMLIGKAKIILTTRKTAIFGGSEFRDWFSKWNNSFNVSRFSIEIPRIKDWLGLKKIEELKLKNIPLEQIANPVLLTYLRNLSNDEFTSHLEEPELIVKRYFYSLMEREKIRQELFIDPDDQYELFSNVAKSMIEFDLSSEKRQFMKDLIAEENRGILEKSLKAYPGNMTVEMLTEKLVNHAIFDRKGREENMIGFINDFVFGSFIGEIMCETSPEIIEKSFPANMVELGATAFRVQNKENKEKLWMKIESLKHKFQLNILFNFDITLKGELLREITNTTIQSSQVYQVVFNDKFLIKDTAFVNCTFKNCVFNPKAFLGISFIQCTFESCIVKGEKYLDVISESFALNCNQIDSNLFYHNSKEFYEQSENNKDEVTQKILIELYDIEKIYKSKRLSILLDRFDFNDRKEVKSKLDKLVQEDFIEVNGLDIYLKLNKIKEVESLIETHA